MTLRDALETGLPYKRKNDLGYYSPKRIRNIRFSLYEVLADDWEVEDPEVTTTKSQELMDENNKNFINTHPILKRLGFDTGRQPLEVLDRYTAGELWRGNCVKKIED